MTTPGDVKTATVNSHKTRFILQDGATSTVAGGTVDVNFDGEYIFSVSGTLNTAKPALYIKRSGADTFYPSSEVTVAGGELEIQLSRGDKVYSQTTIAGGSTAYDTVLNLTTI
jgi:hypothetical protein